MSQRISYKNASDTQRVEVITNNEYLLWHKWEEDHQEDQRSVGKILVKMLKMERSGDSLFSYEGERRSVPPKRCKCRGNAIRNANKTPSVKGNNINVRLACRTERRGERDWNSHVT